MNTNDSKILKLKETIEVKRKELGKPKQFTPVTSCILELPGSERLNIQAMDKQGLINNLVALNSLRMSAAELGYVESLNFTGYNILDWIKDIKSKLEVLSYKDELKNLSALEKKLDKFLSEDKKVEMELDDIMKSLEG